LWSFCHSRFRWWCSSGATPSSFRAATSWCGACAKSPAPAWTKSSGIKEADRSPDLSCPPSHRSPLAPLATGRFYAAPPRPTRLRDSCALAGRDGAKKPKRAVRFKLGKTYFLYVRSELRDPEELSHEEKSIGVLRHCGPFGYRPVCRLHPPYRR